MCVCVCRLPGSGRQLAALLQGIRVLPAAGGGAQHPGKKPTAAGLPEQHRSTAFTPRTWKNPDINEDLSNQSS